MERPTMTKFVHSSRSTGYIIDHGTRLKPNNGRHGPQFTFLVWREERSEVQTQSCPQVQALAQTKVSGDYRRI